MQLLNLLIFAWYMALWQVPSYVVALYSMKEQVEYLDTTTKYYRMYNANPSQIHPVVGSEGCPEHLHVQHHERI